MLKWLVKRISKKWLVVGGIISLLLLLIIYMNKKYIIYAISALITLVAIFFAGRWTAPNKIQTEYICETGYELRDTCLGSTLICTLTTQDSFSVYRIIREGLKKKDTTKHKVEQVEEIVTIEPIKKRTYIKLLDNGITTVWDTVIVEGKILDWKRSHQTDTLIQVEHKTTTTTAIVEAGKDDSKKIEYIPVENNKSQTWIGVEGGVIYYDNPVVPIGLTLDRGRHTFSLVKDVMTPFGELKGYGIKYKRDIIRVSSK